MISDETRTAAAEKLELFIIILLVALVGYLVVSLRVARQDHRAAEVHRAELDRRLARSDALVLQLTTDKNLMTQERQQLIDLALQGSTVVPPQPLVKPCEDRPTPAFPRDSQFPGSQP